MLSKRSKQIEPTEVDGGSMSVSMLVLVSTADGVCMSVSMLVFFKLISDIPELSRVKYLGNKRKLKSKNNHQIIFLS